MKSLICFVSDDMVFDFSPPTKIQKLSQLEEKCKAILLALEKCSANVQNNGNTETDHLEILTRQELIQKLTTVQQEKLSLQKIIKVIHKQRFPPSFHQGCDVNITK